MKLLLPSVLVAEENPTVSSHVKGLLGRTRSSWPLFSVDNGNHALAYLRGMARFAAQVRMPVATLLLMSLTLPQIGAFQILDWIKRQPLLRSLVIGLICSAGDIPEFDEASKHSAHALLQRPIEATQLLTLVNALEGHWASDLEAVPDSARLRLALQPISLLKAQIDGAHPALLPDLILLTNSPPRFLA